MTEFLSTAGMAAFAVKLVDLIKNARWGRQGLNAVVTQLVAWCAGIGVVVVYAQTSFAEALVFKVPGAADLTLATANFADQALIGLGLVSIGSLVGVDFRKAIDRSDSSSVPPLILTPSAGHENIPVPGVPPGAVAFDDVTIRGGEIPPESYARGAVATLADAPRKPRKRTAAKRGAKKAPTKKRPARRR